MDHKEQTSVKFSSTYENFIYEIAYENIVCEIAIILFGGN